jgi:myosin-1
MNVVGFTDAEQTSILRVLATILWLGNVTFREGDDGNAAVADSDVTDFVAYLMEAQPDKVVKVLTTRIMETQRGGRRGALFSRGLTGRC